MAVDPGPDWARMASLLQAAQGSGGSGCAPILMGLPLDLNVGQGLSIQGKGLNADKTVVLAAKSRPGLLGSLCKQMGFDPNEITQSLQKVAQAGAVVQADPSAIYGRADSGLSSAPIQQDRIEEPRIG
jgi:hypothetical protein